MTSTVSKAPHSFAAKVQKTHGFKALCSAPLVAVAAVVVPLLQPVAVAVAVSAVAGCAPGAWGGAQPVRFPQLPRAVRKPAPVPAVAIGVVHAELGLVDGAHVMGHPGRHGAGIGRWSWRGGRRLRLGLRFRLVSHRRGVKQLAAACTSCPAQSAGRGWKLEDNTNHQDIARHSMRAEACRQPAVPSCSRLTCLPAALPGHLLPGLAARVAELVAALAGDVAAPLPQFNHVLALAALLPPPALRHRQKCQILWLAQVAGQLLQGTARGGGRFGDRQR